MNYSGIPLTNILFGNEHSKIKFVCLGNESYKTQIYKFFDNLSDKNIDSIIGVLGYINNTFPVCSHPIKFKKFSGQEFYEIKAYKIRIACFWEKNVLIAFYGIVKKRDDWSKKDTKNVINLYKKLKK